MRIYLAGGMQPDGDGNHWQDQVRWEAYWHEYSDPRHSGATSPFDYTRWDLGAIVLCDAVFAYMPSSNPSGYGLSAEIGFARALGKDITLVNSLTDDRWRHFQFIDQLADRVFGDLGRGINFLKGRA